ncbi:MAG: hypothetical protein KDJ67_10720 [Nitratireductor sp.]|nr:hypothetical protein [Nitratireductor sp.]
MSKVEGIYTAYMTGAAGQGMAMFVFKDGKIAGADIAGLTFAGNYKINASRLIGEVRYRMPAGSVSITGVSFPKSSDWIVVPLSLPEEIDPTETYQVDTPIGPLNAKFVKNVSFGDNDAD